jgi:hypothetical protein
MEVVAGGALCQLVYQLVVGGVGLAVLTLELSIDGGSSNFDGVVGVLGRIPLLP